MSMNERFKVGYTFTIETGEEYFIAAIDMELNIPEYWCYPVSVQKKLKRKPSLMHDDEFNEDYQMCLGERELYELVLTAAEKKLAEGKISVETPLGTLEACIGGDRTNYPEIYTYLVRPDGIEIDLMAVAIKKDSELARAYLYGDTTREEYTKTFDWYKGELMVEVD